MPIAKIRMEAASKPNPDRVYWAVGPKDGAIVRILNSDLHRPSEWPTEENVRCWCFEGQPWRTDEPFFPGVSNE